MASNVDATIPENAQICKDLGFSNHGLVVRSSKGETLWKQADHSVDMEQVRTALRDLTD
ncbi:MAG: hypothetical protein GY716_12315 [bacterium]|nr:hypothetical protein [bacterium]